jgi:Ni/Co efflux regulator RcnB
MKHFVTAAAALALLAAPMGSAFAQGYNHRNDHRNGPAMHGPAMHNSYSHHDSYSHRDWRKGGHIARNDWGRGHKVDWRRHRLHAPARGYEWREVDGNYVLAAVATGLIASVILANQ